mgnify:CR=1 FL=1
MKRLNAFISGVKAEYNQITWPTRKETLKMLLVVVGFCIAMAAFLGLADFVFITILQKYILKA